MSAKTNSIIRSVSMGVVLLYSGFLVYIQHSTAVMLSTAAHVHPCIVPEKGRRGRVGGRWRRKPCFSQWETKDALWKDKPYCSILFLLQTATRPNNMWTYCTSRNGVAGPVAEAHRLSILNKPKHELCRPEGGIFFSFWSLHKGSLFTLLGPHQLYDYLN